MIDKRQCPLAVRIISVGMMTLAVLYGLNGLILSNQVTQNEIKSLLAAFSFLACLTHFYAGAWLPRLDFTARWVALVNVAADCGLACFYIFAESIYRWLPARPHLSDILAHPDFGYILIMCFIALLVLVTCFIVLTHPKTVEAFEAE